MQHRFTVPGEPRGKARHRSRMVTPKEGKGFIHNYNDTDDPNVAYVGFVEEHYQRSEGPKFSGPIRVDIIAYFRIAASDSGLEKNRKLSGMKRPAKKPDKDNIDKLVFDALNKTGFADDASIVDGRTQKVYGNFPRIEVLITTLNEAEGLDLDPKKEPDQDEKTFDQTWKERKDAKEAAEQKRAETKRRKGSKKKANTGAVRKS